jgi:hypothetical protein
MNVDQLVNLENFISKREYLRLNAFIIVESVTEEILKQERCERI